MPVDFFASPCANPAGNCTGCPIPCLTNIPNQQFGITDENGGNSTPARVDTLDPTIWDLIVTNNSAVDVEFKAVDWCVPIYRTGSYDLDDETRTEGQFSSHNIGTDLIKRCEGFLQFDSKILFIEIKRRPNKAGEWIKDAREKFEETILSFREHHAPLSHQIIKPVLVNPLHTGLAGSEMVEFVRQNNITI
jgi:hypothetical protein